MPSRSYLLLLALVEVDIVLPAVLGLVAVREASIEGHGLEVVLAQRVCANIVRVSHCVRSLAGE
jgi:hypothetical protein